MRNIDPVEFASRFAYSELPIMFNGPLCETYVSEHKHEFDEIVLIVSGSGVHHTRLGESRIEAGQVLIIPEGEFHAYSDCSTMTIFNCMVRIRNIPLPLGELYYHPSFARLFLQESSSFDAAGSFPQIQLSAEDFKLSQDIIDHCAKEVDERKLGWSLNCFGGFLQFLTILLRNYQIAEKEAIGIQENLTACLDYLSTHPEQRVTIDELCHKGGLSPSTLYRQFKRTTGMSALEYQLTLKLTRAANLLLAHPELQISEIAYQVGFADSNYFSKIFRSRFHCSPREYRKQGGQLPKNNWKL